MLDESDAHASARAVANDSSPRAHCRRALLLTAALLYAGWLAGPWINPDLDLVNSYVSELAARDQPGSALFRGGDVLAGAGVCAAALLGLLRRPLSGWAAVGWAGLAAFGLATATDAGLTPMDCAPSKDTGCAVREIAGTLSATHELHTLTSSLAGAAVLTGMAGLGVAARLDRGIGPPPRWAAMWFVLTGMATVSTLAALLLGTGVGAPQRVQLVGISSWLLALAFCGRRAEKCSTS